MSSDLELDAATAAPARTVPTTPPTPTTPTTPTTVPDGTPEQLYREGRAMSADVTAVPDTTTDQEDDGSTEEAGYVPRPFPYPLPPFLLRRSGIYRADQIIASPTFPPIPVPVPVPFPGPIPRPDPPIDLPLPGVPGGAAEPAAQGVSGPDAAGLFPFPLTSEELRVDVDGQFPTMTISGTVSRLFGGRLTWIARVTKDPATGAWSGPISYRDGTVSFRPHANVSVTLTGNIFSVPGRKARATFSGGPGADVTRNYSYSTAAFRQVAFEYDTVSDATAVTAYDPSTHPNRPATAPASPLTLEGAYSRVGITVTRTGGDGVIPLEAGANGTWSDQEMHDAMEAHWSRWQDAPQWAIWVLFARQHDMGSSLGGIMFDDIGTAQRQGTAIFSDSFIAQAPAGEASPGPWVQRMRFWTAAHEIGHTFNLAHSWQKSLGAAWVPLANEPSALSYMNYPFNYPSGLDAFFGAFEFTFSPSELLFLRHAPERFVKQGAQAWFDQHGFEHDAFEQLRAAAVGPLGLDLRVHRADRRYEYLEPVVAELRLKNTSSTPLVVDANTLTGDSVALVVSKDGGPSKRWLPFATRCQAPDPKVLQPGESIYTSVFLSAGAGGWLIDEPGGYQVHAAAELGDRGVAMSAPLRVQVARPASAEAAGLGDAVFTREVAHTLAFGGTRQLEDANDVLREVVDRLPGSKAAVHAASALGAPLAAPGKVLAFDAEGVQEKVSVQKADPDQARALLGASLADFGAAADSLGHIGVTEQTERLAGVLAVQGDDSARRDLLRTSADALAARGVLPGVVAGLSRQAD